MPIKDLAWRSGFGYIALEQAVAGWKAAWYVAKYASKHDPSIPRNFRRCRCSRDWAKLPEVNLPAYMVKGKAEHLGEFLVRVSEVCNVPEEVLHTRWNVAHSIFELRDYDD